MPRLPLREPAPLSIARGRSGFATLVAWMALGMTLLASAKAFAEGDIRWKYSVGFDYSRGDYGIDEDTEIVFLPLSIEASGETSRFKLTLPFLNVQGPSSIAIDAEGNERIESDSRAGFGQLSAQLGWFLRPFHRYVPWFEFSTRVTAPTESDDALGSGVWAVSLQVDAFARYGEVSPFARIGRKFYTERLDDRFYSSIGASYRVASRLSLGASYDWSQASSPGNDDGHDLIGFASYRLDPAWSLGPYVGAGLSDGSPDWGLGMTISFRPR